MASTLLQHAPAVANGNGTGSHGGTGTGIGLHSGNGTRSGIDSVLIFRALRLGDMLCAVPALRALRAALPRAQLTLAGLPWAREFATRFHRYIDEFLSFPGHPDLPEQAADPGRWAAFAHQVRARRFDLAVQLHGHAPAVNRIVAGLGAGAAAGFCSPGAPMPNGMHAFAYPDHGPEPLRLLRMLRQLGIPPGSPALEFPTCARDRDELRQSGLAEGLVPGNYVCIHPGAGTGAKGWPARCFAQVADQLVRDTSCTVVLTGFQHEQHEAAAVARHMRLPARHAAGPMSIGALASLMQGARLLVSNDTGVAQLAAGLGLPSVAVSTQSDPTRWAPLNGRLHRWVRDPDGREVDHVLTLVHEIMRDTKGHRPC